MLLKKPKVIKTWMETGGTGKPGARATRPVEKGSVRECASAIILRE